MTDKDLECSKQALIDIILWYRDEYHKAADGRHDALIERVQAARSEDELYAIEQVVDGWLDA